MYYCGRYLHVNIIILSKNVGQILYLSVHIFQMTTSGFIVQTGSRTLASRTKIQKRIRIISRMRTVKKKMTMNLDPLGVTLCTFHTTGMRRTEHRWRLTHIAWRSSWLIRRLRGLEYCDWTGFHATPNISTSVYRKTPRLPHMVSCCTVLGFCCMVDCLVAVLDTILLLFCIHCLVAIPYTFTLSCCYSVHFYTVLLLFSTLLHCLLVIQYTSTMSCCCYSVQVYNVLLLFSTRLQCLVVIK